VSLIVGCSAGVVESGEAGGEYSTDVGPMDSIALIEHAMTAGEIDYSTGMLYKIYALYDPTSLPFEYQSDVPLSGGGGVEAEVQRNWNRLSPEHQDEIGNYIEHLLDLEETDTGLDDVTPDRLEDERNRLD
jgi:hypothetical protein